MSRWGTLGTCVACAVAVAACDGGGAEPGATADAGADAAARVTAPDIPWLAAGEPPVARAHFTCPVGWREVHPIASEPDVVTCDPWPGSGRATCTAPDEAHFPGEPGCTRIGPPCPPGDWAEDLPLARPIVYVKAGAAAGGDGTMARPFARISDARRGAAAGTVIAVAKGRYDEPVSLGGGMALWGACVAETVVTSSDPGMGFGVVGTTGAGAEVRNVWVEAPARIGVGVFFAGQSLRLTAVLVRSAPTIAIAVASGEIVATDVIVRESRGFGLEIGTGGSATFTRSVLEASDDAGALVHDPGSHLTLDRSAVTGTIARTSGSAAIQLTDGTLDAVQSIVEASDRFGIQALGGGVVLQLTDVVVRDAGYMGVGVNGGMLVASRVWVDGATHDGVTAERGSAMLSDLVITGTRVSPGMIDGVGLAGDSGATIVGARLALAHNGLGGVKIRDGSSAALTDLVVVDTDGCGAGCDQGIGVAASSGSRVEVVRAVVARNIEAGIGATGDATVMTLEDVVVRATRERPTDLRLGHDVEVGPGATISAARMLVEEGHGVGILASGAGASLRATDVVVRDVHGNPADGGHGGRGVQSQRGASIEIDRVVIERVREVGLCAATSGSRMVARDAELRDVMFAECHDTTCRDGAGGTAMAAVEGGSARVERFVVSGAPLCGVHVAELGELDLSSGDVAGAAIGACVQVDGYDLARLMNDVVYHDNGVSLQATTLPVPGALDLGEVAP